ncbi:hypothetical protein GIB67_009898 [Kingdonia uniflora]|uniref:tRNA (guanine(9)-N(1))-methyltransferase n=1 Tax=Kingdonia uniflora TaxID=39325 RepID=A0A7J7L4C3_9MAGN|nr:hypothetical protein GIB67_009898 [Kingdonia uniflora]
MGIDGKLELHKMEMNQVHYSVIDMSCLDRNLDLRLILSTKRILTAQPRLPGFNKWIIEKESNLYIEALQDGKERLVYLAADFEIVLEKLDPKSIYIIGGLVDRNRWKGITMKKVIDQGIKTTKLHIGSFLKMSSSQIGTDILFGKNTGYKSLLVLSGSFLTIMGAIQTSVYYT